MGKLTVRSTAIPAKKAPTFAAYAGNPQGVLIQVFEGVCTMTHDNNMLGKSHVCGTPTAPRGVPPVEVTFGIDTHGISSASAQGKSAGLSTPITLTTEKGRRAQPEIGRKVQDTDQCRAEDGANNTIIEAKHGRGNYCFTLCNTLIEEKLEGQFRHGDTEEIGKAVQGTLDRLGKTQLAEKGEFQATHHRSTATAAGYPSAASEGRIRPPPATPNWAMAGPPGSRH
jgi:endoplasmic reticulum chaperone BiP